MASADPDIAKAAASVAGRHRIAITPHHVVDEQMAAARAAQHRKDLDAVDAAAAEAGEMLTDDERERRARLRRRERLARAGLASAKARAARKAAREAARDAAELDTLAEHDAAGAA